MSAGGAVSWGHEYHQRSKGLSAHAQVHPSLPASPDKKPRRTEYCTELGTLAKMNVFAVS